MTDAEQTRAKRSAYPFTYPITTRWSDNDMYGHVNNVYYYSFFDSVINRHLIEHGGLDPVSATVIGVTVESSCRYFSSVAYPADLEGGLRVEHLSNRSVRYGIGIFEAGAEEPSAQGYFVHVFVDREQFKPTAIPDEIRSALEMLAYN